MSSSEYSDSDDSADHDYDIVEEELKKIDKNTHKHETSDVPLLVCPHCGEPRLAYYRMSSGGIFGSPSADQRYICNNCGYIGSVAVEIESAEDIAKIRKNYETSTHNSKNTPIEKSDLMSPGYSWLWKAVFYLDLLVISIIIISPLLGIGRSVFNSLMMTKSLDFILGAILFFSALMIKKSS